MGQNLNDTRQSQKNEQNRLSWDDMGCLSTINWRSFFLQPMAMTCVFTLGLGKIPSPSWLEMSKQSFHVSIGVITTSGLKHVWNHQPANWLCNISKTRKKNEGLDGLYHPCEVKLGVMYYRIALLTLSIVGSKKKYGEIQPRWQVWFFIWPLFCGLYSTPLCLLMMFVVGYLHLKK